MSKELLSQTSSLKQSVCWGILHFMILTFASPLWGMDHGQYEQKKHGRKRSRSLESEPQKEERDPKRQKQEEPLSDLEVEEYLSLLFQPDCTYRLEDIEQWRDQLYSTASKNRTQEIALRAFEIIIDRGMVQREQDNRGQKRKRDEKGDEPPAKRAKQESNVPTVEELMLTIQGEGIGRVDAQRIYARLLTETIENEMDKNRLEAYRRLLEGSFFPVYEQNTDEDSNAHLFLQSPTVQDIPLLLFKFPELTPQQHILPLKGSKQVYRLRQDIQKGELTEEDIKREWRNLYTLYKDTQKALKELPENASRSDQHTHLKNRGLKPWAASQDISLQAYDFILTYDFGGIREEDTPLSDSQSQPHSPVKKSKTKIKRTKTSAYVFLCDYIERLRQQYPEWPTILTQAQHLITGMGISGEWKNRDYEKVWQRMYKNPSLNYVQRAALEILRVGFEAFLRTPAEIEALDDQTRAVYRLQKYLLQKCIHIITPQKEKPASTSPKRESLSSLIRRLGEGKPYLATTLKFHEQCGGDDVSLKEYQGNYPLLTYDPSFKDAKEVFRLIDAALIENIFLIAKQIREPETKVQQTEEGVEVIESPKQRVTVDKKPLSSLIKNGLRRDASLQQYALMVHERCGGDGVNFKAYATTFYTLVREKKSQLTEQDQEVCEVIIRALIHKVFSPKAAIPTGQALKDLSQAIETSIKELKSLPTRTGFQKLEIVYLDQQQQNLAIPLAHFEEDQQYLQALKDQPATTPQEAAVSISSIYYFIDDFIEQLKSSSSDDLAPFKMARDYLHAIRLYYTKGSLSEYKKELKKIKQTPLTDIEQSALLIISQGLQLYEERSKARTAALAGKKNDVSPLSSNKEQNVQPPQSGSNGIREAKPTGTIVSRVEENLRKQLDTHIETLGLSKKEALESMIATQQKEVENLLRMKQEIPRVALFDKNNQLNALRAICNEENYPELAGVVSRLIDQMM